MIQIYLSSFKHTATKVTVFKRAIIDVVLIKNLHLG